MKTATCRCGELSVQVTGNTKLVGVCHCTDCQRRTGSVFSVGAYYGKDQVELRGERKVFRSSNDAGRESRSSFCPNCGATVYVELDLIPDLCVVTVGAFADPAFSAPTMSWWEKSAHDWVRLPDNVQEHQTQ